MPFDVITSDATERIAYAVVMHFRTTIEETAKTETAEGCLLTFRVGVHDVDCRMLASFSEN